MKKMVKSGLALLLLICLMCGCTPAGNPAGSNDSTEPIRRMELKYATGFSVDYYQDGFKMISMADGGRFLVIPEGKESPKDLPEDMTCIQQPVENLYLAASSAMSFFDVLDRVDAITLTGTKQSSWHISCAVDAMAEGRITFAGKYSEPDYELMMERKCPLAIESTMVDRVPEVKEKLRELGIGVLVDCSSLESHPLGRAEWIKLYGALLNEEEKAEEAFQKQVDYLNTVLAEENTGKTVAYFYITSDGVAVAPQADDYVSKMIELAGAKYIFNSEDAPQRDSSTNKMEMEAFFAAAKDADYIIYNSTTEGELSGMDELLQKNKLLQEMKAVQNGNVWCGRENMHQSTTDLGVMVQSFHQIFSGQADQQDEVPYFYRLK